MRSTLTGAFRAVRRAQADGSALAMPLGGNARPTAHDHRYTQRQGICPPGRHPAPILEEQGGTPELIRTGTAG